MIGLSAAPALAAPSAAQTASDRAQVERAVKRLRSARARAELTAERVEQTSAELDRVLEEADQAQARLSSRTRMMYRSGDSNFVSVLLGAATYQEFASRWQLLTRMSRQDAEDLRALAIARTKAERSATSLLKLQADQARSVDSIAREVARARRELANSQAALAAYSAQSAARTKRRAPRPKRDSNQQLTGSGVWKSRSRHTTDATSRDEARAASASDRTR